MTSAVKRARQNASRRRIFKDLHPELKMPNRSRRARGKLQARYWHPKHKES